MNSIELLKESLRELEKWARVGKFRPKTEDDVKCFVYRCLVEKQGTALGIHSEEGFDFYGRKPRQRKLKPDLTIGEGKNKIFVQIKYILRSEKRTEARWKSRKNDAIKDVGKLRALLKKHLDTTGILVVFAESYRKDDDSWYYDIVKESCEAEEPRIMMLTANMHAVK